MDYITLRFLKYEFLKSKPLSLFIIGSICFVWTHIWMCSLLPIVPCIVPSFVSWYCLFGMFTFFFGNVSHSPQLNVHLWIFVLDLQHYLYHTRSPLSKPVKCHIEMKSFNLIFHLRHDAWQNKIWEVITAKEKLEWKIFFSILLNLKAI